jgi:hypothetical protein
MLELQKKQITHCKIALRVMLIDLLLHALLSPIQVML